MERIKLSRVSGLQSARNYLFSKGKVTEALKETKKIELEKLKIHDDHPFFAVRKIWCIK